MKQNFTLRYTNRIANSNEYDMNHRWITHSAVIKLPLVLSTKPLSKCMRAPVLPGEERTCQATPRIQREEQSTKAQDNCKKQRNASECIHSIGTDGCGRAVFLCFCQRNQPIASVKPWHANVIIHIVCTATPAWICRPCGYRLRTHECEPIASMDPYSIVNMHFFVSITMCYAAPGG